MEEEDGVLVRGVVEEMDELIDPGVTVVLTSPTEPAMDVATTVTEDGPLPAVLLPGVTSVGETVPEILGVGEDFVVVAAEDDEVPLLT